MDISPKQLVSVAASLIPFLENDDANRALMGSNMQRQAVPLLRAEAPFVGTGIEEIVARDSGAAITARRAGVVDQVDATRIVVRADARTWPGDPGVDIYRLRKFQRSNQNTCINQRPLVKVGDTVTRGEFIADGPVDRSRRAGARPERARRFMPWNGYNYEDSILISERIVKDDVFTSIHIEEFEVAARDTKLGPEEITRDIPNVGEEALRNLDEAGIVYIGAEVGPADILVGKITPKGESPMTPEEKLLRAIFGEKASDVRDTSLRLPPGDYGTVVEVRVFNRHGVDKDERALQIEREEVERLSRDRDDELAILERNIYSRLREMCSASRGQRPEGRRSPARPSTRSCSDAVARPVVAARPRRGQTRRAEEALHGQFERQEGARAPLRGQGREGPPRRRPAPGRDEDGQGLHRGEAQAPAGRQDGRPSRQQGRRSPRWCRRRTCRSWRTAPRSTSCSTRSACRRRMNVGQILETHLGWAARGLGMAIDEGLKEYRHTGDMTPLKEAMKIAYGEDVYDEAIADLPDEEFLELAGNVTAGVPIAHPGLRRRQGSRRQRRAAAGRLRHLGPVDVFDGRSGEQFTRPVTVGVKYMLKLHHLVDDKIHARSIGPYPPRHPAAAGRQGAVRRPALRRDGGLGAGSLRRRLHAAGDADREVRRRRRPDQGLRVDRQGRGQLRGRRAGIVQRPRQGNPLARPQHRANSMDCVDGPEAAVGGRAGSRSSPPRSSGTLSR